MQEQREGGAGVRLRALTPQRAVGLWKLFSEPIEHTFERQGVVEGSRAERYAMGKVEDGELELRMIEDGDQLVGFVIWRVADDIERLFLVWMLYLYPEHRHQPEVQLRIYRELMRLAHRHGCERLAFCGRPGLGRALGGLVDRRASDFYRTRVFSVEET